MAGSIPAPASAIALGAGKISVAAADFDGDGKLDVAATDNGGVWILIGNGDGTFSPTSASPISDGRVPAQVVTADLNGDGRPDLAIVNQDDTVSVLLGNGDGTFTTALSSPITVGDGTGGAIAVGDFTGDGKLDLAVLSSNPGPSSSGTLTLLLGNGDGTFTPAPGSPVALSADPVSLAVADFNGDGKPDLAIVADTTAASGADSASVSVLLGRGNGSFAYVAAPLVVPDSYFDGIVAADFNDDGHQDIAIGNSPIAAAARGGDVYLLLGDGTGQFREARGSQFPVSTPAPTTTGPDAQGSVTTDGRTGLIVNPGFYSEFEGELYVLLAPLPSQPPTAALAAAPGPAVAGTPVTFDASSSSDPLDRQIVDYRWDLGSGSFTVDTAETPTLSHTFSTPGVYAVRVQVRNTAGETAIATTQLTVRPPVKNALVSGYVRLCGGPAPGGCRASSLVVCRATNGCVTTDRVAAINAQGRRVGIQRLKHARFSLRLVPGRYTIELLGDGKRVHNRVLQTKRVVARANHTTLVRFEFNVP